MFPSQPEIDESPSNELTPNTASDSGPVMEYNQRPRFLSRPHLSHSLILIALLLIITNAYLALINQPPIYWLDTSNVSYTAPVIGTIMANSPFLFAGISAAYLLIVWLALALLPRYPALVIWMALCFIHLRDTIQWSKCGLNQIHYDPSNSLFCGIVDFLLAIIGASILGLILANTWFSKEAPRAIEGQTMPQAKRKLSGKAVIAAVAWISFLTIALVRATMLPDSGWLPITTQNAPTPRADGRIAFDTNRGKAVLFGGATAFLGENNWLTENDTWEWDGMNWTLIIPVTSPPTRHSHALAYDEMRGVTVLYGGRNHQGPLTDTWEWDGTNWTQRFPSISPPASCCHHMYYDSENGKVRLYGGYDGVSFYSDLWEWDGEEWRQLVVNSSSPVASAFGLAYDPDRHQAVTFLAGFPTGIWILRGNHWSNPQFDLEPPQRNNLGLAYDRTLGKHILFGGFQEGQFFNDTWLLDDKWQELDSPLVPPARWGHTLFYDQNRGRIVIFGGFDGKSYLNDMWELVVTEP